jgi:hypothetical protein
MADLLVADQLNRTFPLPRRTLFGGGARRHTVRDRHASAFPAAGDTDA